MKRPLISTAVALLRKYRNWYFRSLGVIALALIAIAWVAFLVEARATATPMSWDEALYSSLGLFFFQLSRLGYPRGLVLRALHFLAPGISASAIFEAFLRVVEEHGGLLFRRLRGHVVVGGLGNLGATIARQQSQHLGSLVAIEINEAAPAVAELRASASAVVLVGDMTSDALLERARCHEAGHVFLTAPSDVTNLDAAFRIRRLHQRLGGKHPPTIFAHVFDGALSTSLEAQLIAPDERGVRIVPWSSYRFAAKALLAEVVRDRLLRAIRVAPGLVLARTSWPDGDPALVETANEAGRRPSVEDELTEDLRRLRLAFVLEAEAVTAAAATAATTATAATADVAAAGGTDEDRFVIVGLGRFGRAVVRELLQVATRRARFLIVERSEAGYQESASHFSDEERAHFEVLIGDAVTPAAMARVVAFEPTAVLVCTDNDLKNLRLAVELRHRELRAVTRMFDLEASPELFHGLHERGISVVGLSRLFRAAIPILTHERRLLGCLNLDVARTPEVDHLYYLARVRSDERARLGRGCVPLSELPRAASLSGAPPIPDELALVWHRSVPLLSTD